MKNDLRFALRQLLKNPGFTAVAVLTLALGIGATTAMFSLVNSVLLRELPFHDGRRLTVIWANDESGRSGLKQLPPANADVAEWREHITSFANIAAFSPRTADLADGGDPERVGAAGVTAGFFETLGVAPVLGRTLVRAEEPPGGPPVALISHGLWQRRFGGDPALLGKDISINGEGRSIIGILPPEFDFPRGAEWPAFFPFEGRTEVWLPLAFRTQDDATGWSNWQSRSERGLAVIGRLKPGTSLRLAQAEMDAYAARQASDHPDTHGDLRVKVISLSEQLAGKSHRALLGLFTATGLLLLIACVNVANLLLARGIARQQEMAMRTALGAGRGRLMRQLLIECLLLAMIGTAVGVTMAAVWLRAFLVLNPMTYSRLDEASLDPAVLGFTTLLAIVTSGIFWLVPALQTSSINLQATLREGGGRTVGSGRERARSLLVNSQVALALVLLTAAGLMVRSLLQVMAVPAGFRAGSVLAFDVQLPNARYSAGSSAANFFQQLTLRLEALPGVRAAGAISYLPLGGGQNLGSFTIEGEPPVVPGREPFTERRWVTPGYFAAMGIPIRQGRVFTPHDTADQPRVVVINETLARQFFADREPLGRQLRAGGALRTVVGVVSDVKSASLESIVGPQIYIPHAQDPWPPMTVVVQADRDPLGLAAGVRHELKQLDALIPAAKMRTMKQVVLNATGARRFTMAILVFFAVAALFLTVMGIYGVVTFLVGRRRREIGIRMALGARRRDVLRLVIQQGMKPVAIGCMAGLAGSLATSRLVASQLYGISPSDPLTLSLMLALLLIAALVACWFPARRAMKTDPFVALRTD